VYCSQCGSLAPAGARFCQSCGAVIAEQSSRIAFEDVKSPPQPAAATTATGWAQPNWNQQPAPSYTQYGAVEYAGFLRRWGAIILDGLIASAVMFVAAIALAMLFALGGGLQTDEDVDAVTGLAYIGGFFAQWLYFAFMESSSWQATLGKRALGIIVTDENGNRLTFGRATGRYWAKFLSYFILMIGFLMAAFTPKKQALHDMVANTLVVVGKRS
jgi:uncharacterized RDD family membrane protein YckC